MSEVAHMLQSPRPLMVGMPETGRLRIASILGLARRCAQDYSVEDRSQFTAAIDHDRWDAILLDESNWRRDGSAVRGLMAERGLDLPVIALLNALDTEAVENCLRGVLSDCVTWSELPRLALVIKRHVQEAQERARRHEAEQQLRLSERRYRMLVRNMQEGVLMTDGDAVITFVNARLAAMVEYTPEELVGRPVLDIIMPSRHDAAGETFKSLLRNAPVTRETLLRAKSGDCVEVIARVVPVFTDDGRFDYGFATIQDITERRQLERQVRQSQKMEAIGQLASGVAHDFNNLLTVIGGNAELLRHGEELSPRGRDLLAQIARASDSAGELTGQLLAFGRKQEMKLESLDLNEVISETVPMLRRVMRANIELRVDLAEDLALTQAGRVQMAQVLVNLAINARDAMPEGGVLCIETENVSLDENYAASHAEVEAGDYVKLSIWDTGVGMDSETAERIFEPFFTTKREGEGTGLGLAMVYGIIRQIGGWVWVYSELGQGTVFKIYLPVGRGEPTSMQSDSDERDLRGDETVLFVEDDEQVRRFAVTALEQHGYTVLEAEDAAQALEVLQSSRGVDLIITDVVMPDLSGGEFVEEAGDVR
ncbi:MAG: hybrid sensor histidine kinase/response regulator, partial [Armatimonadota bacterium]